MERSNDYYKIKYFKYKAKYEGLKAEIYGGSKSPGVLKFANFLTRTVFTKSTETLRNLHRRSLIELILKSAIEKNMKIEIKNFNDVKAVIKQLFTDQEQKELNIDLRMMHCSNSSFTNSIDKTCEINKNDNYYQKLITISQEIAMYEEKLEKEKAEAEAKNRK
jgi:hypothetical protein